MQQKRFAILIAVFFFAFQAVLSAQGVTTANIFGFVTGAQDEAIIGATVVATHLPSGTTYGAVTRVDGRYNLPNVRVGGPYSITVSYTGYQQSEASNISLALGQTFEQNFGLSEQATLLEEATVSALRFDNAERTGSETEVDSLTVNLMPTLNRGISDYARLTPEANVNAVEGISIAGQNNRYNSIFIDGAVNNDVFGLSSSGTNGGQAGISPISGDAIEQFQISVAPYDVRLGGFAGGAINAVTRSGSNNVEGSVYYFFRNENLAGKDVWNTNPARLAEFNTFITGARVGGPIIRNKLFFFLNAEIQREETPQPFTFENFNGNATEAQLQTLVNRLNEFGYNPGGYLNNTRTTDSDKFFARLDWNINQRHKLMLRHSYTKGEQVQANRSSANVINFANNGVFFPTTTNSTALELTSTFSEKFANKLIIGATTVRDDRDPIGGNFPSVTIQDTLNSSIVFGTEAFSGGNELNQNILTLTDNFTYYAGAHEITIGTHNEFYNIYNLFIGRNYGQYTYRSLNDFLQNRPPTNYRVGYSLVDDVTGDGSAAAADFNAMQLGLYVQDEWRINRRFRLTAGLRADYAAIVDDPNVDPNFNNVTIQRLEAAGKELEGARAGAVPDPQILVSPRLGFNYDLAGNSRTILRGGVGIFTSRVPFVWPGGMFTNNGVTVAQLNITNATALSNITFRPDFQNQYVASELGATVAKGQVDLFSSDFKYPQVFKTSLAVDQRLPWGMKLTLEGSYAKTLNNLNVYQLNAGNQRARLNAPGDNRPLFSRDSVLDKTYTGIFLNTNTNEGYSYTFTAWLEKSFSNGFFGSVSYTFNRAKVINDATSSQNISNWEFMEQVNGRNSLDLSYSDFDLGHKVTAFVSYGIDYLRFGRSTIALFLNAQSGPRFSYVYGYASSSGGLTNEPFSGTFTVSDLIYIPRNREDINLIDKGTVTAQQQWDALNAYIESDDYLKEHRGGYAERNGARQPFQTVLDLKFAQDFYIRAGGMRHQLQFTFDVFNFTNLLNKDWGRRYFVTNDQYALITFEGWADAARTVPRYSFTAPRNGNPWNIDDSGVGSSRWQGQIGLRYFFQ